MEAKRTAAVSESELNKASKGLHATKGTREHSDSLEFDPVVAEKLEALYEKLDGDIQAIFEVRPFEVQQLLHEVLRSSLLTSSLTSGGCCFEGAGRESTQSTEVSADVGRRVRQEVCARLLHDG
ncbi:unnamed protein product [Phytophthora fragariaefolia]|uniref:Unnamed protein product n=1 Tax=Phytophthora fragariaefolia TaxID=1490495 RepID=A0A9W6XH13_9STRA|nr:unnamed protein product [Phytophthora fragariaefolia]